jgi:hypothetical protein
VIIAYAYLAFWHRTPLLWNILIHENGRLTLGDSIFYFDHFLGCVPMIVTFSLCIAGGLSVGKTSSYKSNYSRSGKIAAFLLIASILLVVASFAASIHTVGWDRTLDYALQRIERDGVLSKGGNWNQQLLSNIPIALGAVGLSSAFSVFITKQPQLKKDKWPVPGVTYIILALVITLVISAFTFPGWQAFINPRWVAHSIREMATYPLTGIPIGVTAGIIVDRLVCKCDRYQVTPRKSSIALIIAGLIILAVQLAYLNNVDILAIAQKPAFAEEGLSIAYLLFSHVFEHLLDFLLVAMLTGGLYSLTHLNWKHVFLPKESY